MKSVLTIRLDPQLRKHLEEKAKEQSRTLGGLIHLLLEKAVKESATNVQR